MSDEEWPDPKGTGRRRQLVSLRLACSLAVVLVLIAAFESTITAAWGMLWPPFDPLSRWFFLLLLHVGSVVVLPMLVGSFVADLLYKRVYRE